MDGTSQPGLPIEDIMVRLADEGIPVRAIARASRVPSSDVYELLKGAVLQGAILELPRDDWPIGTKRNARTTFQGTPFELEEALKFACVRFFKASRMEAAILSQMLRRNEVTKQQLHTAIEQNRATKNQDETDPKMVDVMICKLRKRLKPHNITIDTMWGIGYAISAVNRDRTFTILNSLPAGEGGPE